ncbi:unnamed protein product [Rotaria sp. Silwood2]|nr:unnamed protein product [Rotaria sp. Silwood2]
MDTTMDTPRQKCGICNQRDVSNEMSLFCEICVATTVNEKLSTMSMKENDALLKYLEKDAGSEQCDDCNQIIRIHEYCLENNNEKLYCIDCGINKKQFDNIIIKNENIKEAEKRSIKRIQNIIKKIRTTTNRN